MKKIILLLPFLCFVFVLFSQTPSKYWIEFKDKKGTPYSIDKPWEFLSQRAIELRKSHNIAIDERDLPVNPDYVNRVLALDSTARCFTKSKWMNGITVYAEREDMKQAVEQLPFVKYVETTIRMKEPEPPQEPEYQFPAVAGDVRFSYGDDIRKYNDFDYGLASIQVSINNVQWLHRLGYRGEGIRMMILDGGFQNIDTISCFKSLREDNRLLGARNLVQPEKDPMRKHTHGTMVLSCIASYLPNKLVGTAPMVEVFVCQTEDSRSENRIEEDNWVAGLEYADSLGCQVLNSSLGYTTFDDTINQRTYQDLDGNTSRASRAATIAASKGLLICNSAGNEGGKKWNYIGAPADANDILTVGAVNTEGKRAFFSSFGPTADGRTKPDACAVGRNTFLSTPTGVITVANGTSFSSPMLSGMVACLWQAFPNKTNYQIMDAVRKAGDRYPADVPGLSNLSLPLDNDNGYGYGVTNFLKAYNILKSGDQDSHIVLINDARTYSVTKQIDFLVRNSLSSENYNQIEVLATQVNFKSSELVWGTTKKLKVKNVLKKTNYANNELLCHSVTLPSVKKNSRYSTYLIEIVVDGVKTSFIIGQKKPEGF